MRIFLIVILTLLTIRCKDESKLEVEYYDNGNIKTEYRTNSKGILDGLNKSFYKDGKLKYEGEYRDGLRIGEHREYYPNGVLKQSFAYTIENGHEKSLSKKIFDEEGLILYDGKVVNKDFYFSGLNSDLMEGDTLRLLVKLKDPTYFNSVIFLGDYDPYLKLRGDAKNVVEFDGKKNEVVVSVKVKPGTNIVKGLFRDFTFKPYPNNDSLAYTTAEESYFEYQFKVDPQIKL